MRLLLRSHLTNQLNNEKDQHVCQMVVLLGQLSAYLDMTRCVASINHSTVSPAMFVAEGTGVDPFCG